MRHGTTSIMRRSRTSAVGAWLLFAFAAIPAFAQPNSMLVRRGEAVLSRQCALCHAIGRYGDSRQGRTFVDIARRSDLAAVRKSLETGITSGHPEMPKVTLTGNDIEAIIAYLRTIAQP